MNILNCLKKHLICESKNWRHFKYVTEVSKFLSLRNQISILELGTTCKNDKCAPIHFLKFCFRYFSSNIVMKEHKDYNLRNEKLGFGTWIFDSGVSQVDSSVKYLKCRCQEWLKKELFDFETWHFYLEFIRKNVCSEEVFFRIFSNQMEKYAQKSLNQ